MSAFLILAATPWEGRGPATTRHQFVLRLDLLGYGKRVVYLDAEIAHRAFQLRVPERVGFILRISFLIENQRPAAHRSVLAVATGCAGR